MIMVLVGFLLAFFAGFFCVVFIDKGRVLGWQELVGLSFPCGIAQIVFSMLLLDWIGIPLTCFSVGFAACLFILLWLALCVSLHRSFRISLNKEKPRWGWLNLSYCVFFAVVAYLVCINFVNTLYYPYFPHFERDSISGYETIGYLVSQEHTLRGLSVFQPDENPLMRVSRSYIGYAPLTQLSFTYIYLFGAETNKLVPAMMFVSFLLVFYGLMKKHSGALTAIIATFFMVITPKLLEMSMLSLTNGPHIIYASLGVVYGLCMILQERQGVNNPTYLYLSALLLSASVLTRSDGVVFPCALGLVFLYESFRNRLSWKNFLFWSGLIFFVFVFWALYRKTGNLATENFFITHFFWDEARAEQIVKTSFRLLFSGFYYGWTFYFFVLAFLVELFFIIRKKSSLFVCFFVPVLSLLFFFLLVYHMDFSKWQDLLSAVLTDSAMRFYLCLVPLVWFAVFSSHGIKFLLKKAEERLSFTNGLCCFLPLAILCVLGSGCREKNAQGKTNRFYTESDLKVGDYFYQDGTWSDGGLRAVYADGSYLLADIKPRPMENKKVIGIVFQTDTNRIGQAEKNELRKLGIKQPHGLVVAVKNAGNGTSCSWGPWKVSTQLVRLRKKDCFADISGLGNRRVLEQIYSNNQDWLNLYPAFMYAHSFQFADSTAAPKNTTGWILPGLGQWWDILQNLGGATILTKQEEQTSRQSGGLAWYGQRGVCDKLNTWMQNINPQDKNPFKKPFDVYWSSSEYNSRTARYVALENSYGYLYMEWCSKPYRHFVRCVLAF